MKDLITNSMPKVQQISFRSAQAAEKGLKDEWLSLFIKIIHTNSNIFYILNYFLFKIKELYKSL